MRRIVPISMPASTLQYVLWGWCLFTAGWYLFVTLVVVITGDAGFNVLLTLWLLQVISAPMVFAWGCLGWTTRAGWIARCAGLVLMIIGFLGLSLFSVLVLPFVFFSLPSAWRFHR